LSVSNTSREDVRTWLPLLLVARSRRLRSSGGELLEAPCWLPEDCGYVVGDPVGFAFREEAECLGVHLGDVLWKADAHHRLLLLLVGERVKADWTPEHP
jgi:hypothetical protein